VRTIVRISFGVRGRSQRDVRRILLAAGRPDAEDPDFPLYSFEFDVRAGGLAELRAVLAEMGVKWSEHVDHRYTDREIQQAELVLPILRRADQGMGGPSEGTAYDVSEACPRCGVGARQVGPLKLKGYEIRSPKGKLFPTAHGEWLFAEEVANRLSTFSGLELRQAVDVISGKPLPWYQALAEYELPPKARTTVGVKGFGCPHCGRGGHFHDGQVPPLFVYDRSHLNITDVPDASHTFEHFRWGTVKEPLDESCFAQPHLIIKPAVVTALREAKVRQLQFYPVSLVESAE
jgi:hypothetical protein